MFRSVSDVSGCTGHFSFLRHKLRTQLMGSIPQDFSLSIPIVLSEAWVSDYMTNKALFFCSL